MKFFCVLFVFLIITSNSSSANQFLKHFSFHVGYLESKYFFSYLLSQYNIILDSHEILMERNLWKHLVQLPAHISYKGRPGFTRFYCENKGWTQHTLFITRQPVSADESFFLLSSLDFSFFSLGPLSLIPTPPHCYEQPGSPFSIRLHYFVGSSFEILSAV